MEFYTSSKEKRPVRLSEETRRFAYESLNHKYGLDTLATPYITLDGYGDTGSLQQLLRMYDAAIGAIVENAPVRVCEHELVSGAATLGQAISNSVPVLISGLSCRFMPGNSHLTADFSEVLAIGMDGIREKALRSLENHQDEDKKAFLRSCIHCIDCMRIWRDRYLDELKKRPWAERNIKNLLQVPFRPAGNFYEAVQCIWFCFAFMRLCGVWPGFGRIDVLLGGYLKKDLADGSLTLDEAREILAHFFIKGCEWITGKETYGGDAQHYQNIVLSGIGEDGRDVTNEVTYLVLDIVEETGISDFPVSVRVNGQTDEKLLRRVGEVISFGGGIVAVYNEDTVIRAFERMGYGSAEARNFANDGCWEVQIPGKTRFDYDPFDGLLLLQKITLRDYDGRAVFNSFDELLEKYEADLKKHVGIIFDSAATPRFDGNMKHIRHAPCTVLSLFVQDCVGRGLSYLEGGPVYEIISPHIGGLPDVANSLYAIKKAVFDDRLVSFPRLLEILKNNWEGEEELRLRILNGYRYFGNDNDEVDMIAARILDSFSASCEAYDRKTPARFVSGVSTFGRQVPWTSERLAAPFGRKKGDVLSGNLSPTPGTDRDGATAIIRSYCKADLSKQGTGAALDIGLIPAGADRENAVTDAVGLIKGFAALGGFFMQIDTVDRNVLIEAQKNPQNYQNLSVRVSGWNARFVTMGKDWQDMIIERTH